MSPTERMIARFEQIMKKHFDDFMKDEFLEYARNKQDLENKIAKALFLEAWNEVKYELYNLQSPITYELAVEFCKKYFHDPQSTANENYFEIWHEIFLEDQYDFQVFKNMEIAQRAKIAYAEAETKEDKNTVMREETIRRLINKAFLETKHTASGSRQRFAHIYFNALKILEAFLIKSGIPISPIEMEWLHKTIEGAVPSLKGNNDFKKSLLLFQTSFAKIPPADIQTIIITEEEIIPEIREEDIEEIESLIEPEATDEEDEEEIEVEVEPIISLTIKKSTINSSTMEMVVKEVMEDVSDWKELASVFNSIELDDGFIDDNFKDLVIDHRKSLRELALQLLTAARDEGKEAHLKIIVFHLKKALEGRVQKIDRKTNSKKELKMLNIFATLGPLESEISEIMPPTFHQNSTFKIT